MHHLLFCCPFPRQVWQQMLAWLRMSCTPPDHDTSLLDWWHAAKQRTPQPMRKGLASIALLTPWMIWKHRNECVFEGAQSGNTVTNVSSRAPNLQSAALLRRLRMRRRSRPKLVLQGFATLCPRPGMYINFLHFSLPVPLRRTVT